MSEAYLPDYREIRQVRWVHTWTEWVGDDGMTAESHHRCDLPTYEIMLTVADFAAARHYANIAATNQKPDSNYNSGITPDAMFLGKLGEIGYGALYGLPVEIGFLEGGDQCDFTLPHGTVDIKTATSARSTGLIRRYDENSRLKELTADHYVFATTDQSMVRIFGYLPKADVYAPAGVPRRTDLGFGADARHRNYTIHHHELRSIVELGLPLVGIDTSLLTMDISEAHSFAERS